MSSTTYRLYIFTGKGGVGKTTLAMAYTKYLESIGKKVKYNSFFQNTNYLLAESINLPLIDLKLENSAETYIAKKLNSKTVASWIMKTHFFKALFQMIPGLGHMILLGHLIEELKNDPELIIILDSPASGHALTMFESAGNFKKIFGSGMIVRDINQMQDFIKLDHCLKTFMISLPSELSLTEASELQNELANNLQDIKIESEILINDSFLSYFQKNNLDQEKLPDFLNSKIFFEKNLPNEYKKIPHGVYNNDSELIKGLIEDLKELNI